MNDSANPPPLPEPDIAQVLLRYGEKWQIQQTRLGKTELDPIAWTAVERTQPAAAIHVIAGRSLGELAELLAETENSDGSR